MTTTTIKKNLFNYEFEKSKKYFLRFTLITILSQLLTFTFFSMIGRFETDDAVLGDFHSIHGLASTATMCVITVVAAVFLRSAVVKKYIGNEQIRTYLYPIKRSKLFLSKLLSFSLIMVLGILLGEVFSLIIEFQIGKKFQLSNFSIGKELIPSLAVCILCCLFTLSIVFVSCQVGIKLQSEVSTVITAVIGVVILSNISALGAISYLWITLCIGFLLLFVSSILIRTTGKNVDNKEIR